MSPSSSRRRVLNDISLNIIRDGENENKEIQNKNIAKNDSTYNNKKRQINQNNKINNISRSTSLSKKSKNFKNQKPLVTALFIGNLSLDVNEEKLKQVFKKFPSLVSVKICTNSTTKESLGYGYLNFGDKEDAEKATEEFNYINLFGNEVKIMPSLRNSFYRKNIGTNLFFCNLPLDNKELTTRRFYDTFKKYGKILSCKLDKRKNIGFVYFDNDKSAKEVIKDFNNKEFFGTKILCGLHFDKDVRTFPEFEKRKLKLDANDFIREELIVEEDDNKTALESTSNQINNNINTIINNSTNNNNNNSNNISSTESNYVIDSNSIIDETNKKTYPNSVFVKNLPINTTDEEILDYFSVAGPIKSVFSSKVPKFNSLWSIITYKKSSDSIKAIQTYDNKTFKEKVISVTKAHSKLHESQNYSTYQNYDNYKKIIYLTNLSPDCSVSFLTKFCQHSNIHAEDIQIYAEVINNNNSNNSNSNNNNTTLLSGYIKCKSKYEASKLFELFNGKLIYGNIIKASWVREIPQNYKKNFRTPTNLTSQNVIPVQPYSLGYHGYFPPFNQFKHPLNNLKNWGPDTNLLNDPLKKSFLESLKLIIKRTLNYINSNLNLKDSDLTCISEYILKVYWRNEVINLSNFLMLLDTNIQSQKILQYQLEEAIRFLGYEK
ncbi:hypothetical protein Kpol_1008p23 [Vanderwaltozyma polyspora DSM 70294]|uniref:RRM domain-containing protein n=1 Tax=Vanderwaltozyma polyspora (strain ATCC 22028 / DSM 70294 / BCRC 21397 / CBS 2163 / NBRC 10782 / NRRL Y-8283 / UCD 57-17) TaxID=436907 RepID=A7TPY7_VANPO|nr:uncharacterized protein Kpol_1008p23 [Vanderwaltozyma polyspora DSM 70294]EDO15685.1 hypothetical protein Kpol_1008p23 [Vanderwaltozyma polyspora DSM 70294]